MGTAQPTIRAARSVAKAVHSVSSSTAATASDLVVTTGMTTSAGRMGFLTRSLIPVSGMPLPRRCRQRHSRNARRQPTRWTMTPPKLDVDFGLSAPGGKTTFGHPAASDYNLNLLWNRAHVLGWTGTANGTGGYDLNNSVMVSAVGPAAVQGAPACGNPSSGFSWEPSAGTHNPAPSSPAPVASSCGVEVVYATPGSNVVSEFGGSGTTIPENRFDDFAAWATTNSQQNALQSAGADWFNAPARGFAVHARWQWQLHANSAMPTTSWSER